MLSHALELLRRTGLASGAGSARLDPRPDRATLFSAIRGDAREEAPVFVSRKGSSLCTTQAFRIVRRAARQIERAEPGGRQRRPGRARGCLHCGETGLDALRVLGDEAFRMVDTIAPLVRGIKEETV